MYINMCGQYCTLAPEPAPVGSFNHQRPKGLARPFEHQTGESTNVEFPNRHQGAVHEMQQHSTTPLSRKPKRNHQNQRQTHRQTQQHWEPQSATLWPASLLHWSDKNF